MSPLVRGVRMAVDVGSVRVGVAQSDPDGLLATPVETVGRDASPTPEPGTETTAGTALPRPRDVQRIADLVAERDAVVVYVGLPRSLSGGEGSAAAAARTYAGVLAHSIAPVPVRLVDERMSTVSAHQALHASGRAGRRHRPVVDQVAAVVILQSALEAERGTGARSGQLVEVVGGDDSSGQTGRG